MMYVPAQAGQGTCPTGTPSRTSDWQPTQLAAALQVWHLQAADSETHMLGWQCTTHTRAHHWCTPEVKQQPLLTQSSISTHRPLTKRHTAHACLCTKQLLARSSWLQTTNSATQRLCEAMSERHCFCWHLSISITQQHCHPQAPS